jgi:hypothetical protein
VRDYHSEIIDDFDRRVRSVPVTAPTGSGKMVIALILRRNSSDPLAVCLGAFGPGCSSECADE